MIIKCRAPLRLGLAGGGTDVSPYCDIYGGCVLNATIDRYVHVSLEPLKGNSVIFEAGDLEQLEILPASPSYPLNTGLILHRAVYNYFIEHYNSAIPVPLRAHTLAEAPAGSGLGTSSTLVVALCAAYAEYFHAPLDEYSIANLAWLIERKHCQLAGGKQDQYTAAFGGVNFMEFLTDGRVLVNPLRIKKWILTEFESSLLLYFTGASRSSEIIIRKQSRNAASGPGDSLTAMHEIRQEAYNMKADLLTGDFTSLVDCFRKGWESKKRMAKEISNSFIESLYETAMDNGAEAAKISGAGGGGFMMFIVPPMCRSSVLRALKRFGGEMFPAHFTKSGVEVWRK